MPLVPPPSPEGHGYAGTFIAFEGGDGAGKSTQLRLLADCLVDAGHDVVPTREPGGTPVGAAIREVLLHGEHVDPRAEALLFAADRAHHVATVVRPALERGAVVLCDRYVDSSVAYQGVARDLDASDIRSLSMWATGTLWPDLTVLLDVDPARGHSRRDGEADRMEAEDEVFHEHVRQAFLDLAAAHPGRYMTVDAAGAAESVHKIVRARTVDLLGLHEGGGP
ncbi:MAG TPA: dTMP kinase [Ornithinimicrobium sp.]|uniref:dTMP kinase n=1 Tax=Ornithinimicrobium sp. TaxID=1977084 RepID=UPI002B47CFC3|nr:dTMP kinase [Ornithinimicrobium sp.]HKJ12187.1 dTMP kinase [Ornithinimicrobium sp.]